MAGFTRTGSTACKFIEKSLKQYFLDNMTLRLTCIPAALDGVTEGEERLTTGVTAMVEVAAGAGEDTSCTVGSEVDDDDEEEGGNISLVTSCTVIWSRNWKCWRHGELQS